MDQCNTLNITAFEQMIIIEKPDDDLEADKIINIIRRVTRKYFTTYNTISIGANNDTIYRIIYLLSTEYDIYII